MTKRSLDPQAGLRLLEPGPVALVTSMFKSQPNMMAAAWIAPLGFDPPMISLAIHPGRLSHEFISKSETFGISIPTMDLIKSVHRCGLVSGRTEDKFETTRLTPVDPDEIEAPKIDECVAHLECGVIQRISLADHDLFIGQILSAEADSQYFVERWFAEEELPLVHHIAAEYYAGMTRAYSVSFEEEDEE